MTNNNGSNGGDFDPAEASRSLEDALKKLDKQPQAKQLPPRIEPVLEMGNVSTVEKKEEKKEREDAETQALFDQYYGLLLQKYSGRGFFNEQFSKQDLSEVLDLLLESLSSADRKKMMNYLSQDINKVNAKDQKTRFSPVRFLETHLYGYANFEDALLNNDVKKVDLAGEPKERYENQLWALGKFLERQKAFIASTDIPSYKDQQHREAVNSLERSWRSLYLNVDERLPKAVPNEFLRQFWFDDSRGRPRAAFLSKGQKNEFSDSLDILHGDWRRLAKFTVDWEKKEVDQLKTKVLADKHLQQNETDLEMIKNLTEQILADAKFEGREALKLDSEISQADKFLNKWLRSSDGKRGNKPGFFFRLYGALNSFKEISWKKPPVSEKDLEKAKNDLLKTLIQLENELMRMSELSENTSRQQAELQKPAQTKTFELPESVLDEPVVAELPERVSVSDLSELVDEEEPALSETFSKPETEPEVPENLPEEKIETKSADYKINPEEYTFLHRVLGDVDLRKVVFSRTKEDSVELGEKIIKASTDVDLSLVNKEDFEGLLHLVVEVFHEKINQLLMEVDRINDPLLMNLKTLLESKLKVSVKPGYNELSDMGELLRRLETYAQLKNALDLNQA